jgi:hypothetical protein
MASAKISTDNISIEKVPVENKEFKDKEYVEGLIEKIKESERKFKSFPNYEIIKNVEDLNKDFKFVLQYKDTDKELNEIVNRKTLPYNLMGTKYYIIPLNLVKYVNDDYNYMVVKPKKANGYFIRKHYNSFICNNMDIVSYDINNIEDLHILNIHGLFTGYTDNLFMRKMSKKEEICLFNYLIENSLYYHEDFIEKVYNYEEVYNEIDEYTKLLYIHITMIINNLKRYRESLQQDYLDRLDNLYDQIDQYIIDPRFNNNLYRKKETDDIIKRLFNCYKFNKMFTYKAKRFIDNILIRMPGILRYNILSETHPYFFKYDIITHNNLEMNIIKSGLKEYPEYYILFQDELKNDKDYIYEKRCMKENILNIKYFNDPDYRSESRFNCEYKNATLLEYIV